MKMNVNEHTDEQGGLAEPVNWRVGKSNLQYGHEYDGETGLVVENGEEQAVIRRVKGLRERGVSLKRICEQLFQDGVMNRAGSTKWYVRTVFQIAKYKGLSSRWLRYNEQTLARLAAAKAASSVPLDEPDPARWGEAHLLNRDGAARQYWSHQVEDLRAEDGNIIHLDGRDVGKTADLSTLALHYALTTANGSGLVAAALNGQLLSILEEIEFQLENNPRLDDEIAVSAGGRRKFQRTPYPRLEFRNGSVLYFRPAGAYGEAFRSLHVDRIWVDEGAWLSEEAWRALRQCLKAGGKIRVYSTPNGVRGTTYYRLTESPRWRVFRWPSWLNPAWDKDREADLLEFYGGKSSAGWQHEVAGEHGAASFGAFSAEAFGRCLAEVIEYRKVVITGEDLGAREHDEEEVAGMLDGLLGLAPQRGMFWIGADLGYTCDPTEILVFEEVEEEEGEMGKRGKGEGEDGERGGSPSLRAERSNPPALIARVNSKYGGLLRSARNDGVKTSTARMKLVLRVHMESVGYPQIGQCLAILDMMFSPMAIGVDNGGNGMAVVQELMSLDKYRAHEFGGRLFGFDFGSVTTFDLPNNGMAARKRTKELMTSLITGALQRREIVFPLQDKEIEDQFLTQTYSMNNGVVVYSKGNDHIIDAARCMMLARENVRPEGLLAQSFDRRPVLSPRIEFWTSR